MRNIIGDREIEWGFVMNNMPPGPGTALDFGPGGSALASVAAGKGYSVMAVDLDAADWKPQAGVTFVHGDIFEIGLPGSFDLIIACSTMEHVGVVGRYGVTKAKPDDLDAMKLLRGKMNPGAAMLLTVPVGQDADFAPLCRVYGGVRLPLLLGGFAIEKEEYWTKDEDNEWLLSDRATALNEETTVHSYDPAEDYYALGCFVLRGP